MGREIYTAESFSAFWQEVIRPWLKDVSQNCWKEKKPCVVLVPSGAWAHFIKSKMAEERIGAVELQFWFPSDLREFLKKKFTPDFLLGDQPTFHLLLSAAATSPKADFLEKAIMADPSALWREMERGMDSKNFDDGITKKFLKLKNKTNFFTAREIDTELFAKASKNKSLFQSLLIFGFDASHWQVWNLLRAGVCASEQSTICLALPKKYAESLDMTWIGSWEQFLGASKLVTAEDNHSEKQKNSFYAATDVRQQAEAVVLQTAKFLQEEECRRLGILVPGMGALAREIAVLLDQMDIPHYDGIGHLTASLTDQDAWNAWLEWQADPNLLSLLKFIRLFHRAPEIFALKIEDIEKLFRDALAETLVNDIAVAKSFWTQSDSADARAFAEKLEFWKILPEQVFLKDYLSQTAEFFHHLGWKSRVSLVETFKETYQNCHDVECIRAAYLRWLGDLAETKQRTREANGAHAFSRVQILPYANAEGQEWSHLIFTGLNEGVWPQPIEASGWITEEEIFKHNRAAVMQGSQGEGHITVKEGKEICLGPIELRLIQQRQFQSLTESAQKLAFTWSTTDESRQILSPSDFLTKFYFHHKGLALDEKTIHDIAEQTSLWISSSEMPLLPWPKRSGLQTKKIYDARRDVDSPFGIYDFCLASPPQEQLRLACKQFEEALRDPSKIWMQIFLGITPPIEWELSSLWNMTRGSWAHDWLRFAFNPDGKKISVSREKINILREHFLQSAQQKRARIEKIFSAAGWKLPNEWIAAWNEASWSASHLLEAVGEVKDWPYAVTERKFKVDISLEKNLLLLLTSKPDLILLKQKQEKDSFVGEAWVMDYKTGRAAEKVSKKELHKGKGLQLLLYALSLEALGAKPVFLSTVLVEEEITEELKAENLSSFANFWKGLARMEQTGIFGMRGELRPEYSFKEKYPTAFLPIDKDLLEERWNLTHPLLEKL